MLFWHTNMIRSRVSSQIRYTKTDAGTRRFPSLFPSSHGYQLYSSSPSSFLEHELGHQSSATSSFQMYNSLTSKVETMTQKNLGTQQKGMAIYTCGPTVYDATHLGHARTFVWMDIFRRLLEDSHHHDSRSVTTTSAPQNPPLFVMNITDVDDKIISAAKAANTSPRALARRWEAAFWNDLDALNCLRPHVVTRVTDYVESDIVPYIEKIASHGMAYELPDGIYFDVRSYEDKVGVQGSRYGKLAPPKDSTDFYKRRQESIETTMDNNFQTEDRNNLKKDARDFALWKKKTNMSSDSNNTNEDGNAMPNMMDSHDDLCWASPWGPGRPGWHIECSAMIEAIQKEFSNSHKFTIHCGGIDLKFPHHTNEIAQAEAFEYKAESTTVSNNEKREEWIPHWIHTGHLHIDGRKMSKSLKNFVTVQELMSIGEQSQDEAFPEGSDPQVRSLSSSATSPADDFRLWCLGLSGSYREGATYSPDRIRHARFLREEKLVRFLVEGEEWVRRRHRQGDENGSKSAADPQMMNRKWNSKSTLLFQETIDACARCRKALDVDLDGASFVDELVGIADRGRAYMSEHPNTNTTDRNASTVNCGQVEVLIFTLGNVRSMLKLVGFSNATVDAGRLDMYSSSSSTTSTQLDLVVDELVRFRAHVRKAAMVDIKSKKLEKDKNESGSSSSLAMEILSLCDQAVMKLSQLWE